MRVVLDRRSFSRSTNRNRFFLAGFFYDLILHYIDA